MAGEERGGEDTAQNSQIYTLSVFVHRSAKHVFMLQDKSQTAELWEKLSFGNKDQNVKFRKLMGIKVSGLLYYI